jgi:ribose/xylose/arabinose/galactoside ABC-type transport system permease subunit
MKGPPPVLITATVLVAGFVLCALQFPNVASTRVVCNLLTDNFLGIVATGLTFVIISGGIDLPVDSVIGSTTATFLGVLIQRLIQTCINFDGTLSSWWTNIATGVLLFAFIALQQVMIAIARCPALRPAGATS